MYFNIISVNYPDRLEIEHIKLCLKSWGVLTCGS